MEYSIDAVIPWVDGNDPVLNSKRRSYAPEHLFSHNDSHGATRFASIGEIYWCVASINRFAPWISRIFIVTDGQDPGMDAYLNEHFPGSHIPVKIVDHKDIFRGYESYLPVFNSNAIETMIWRIPGLSEHFILFNDDFLLTAQVQPEDFFLPDGRIVCYADRHNTALTKLTRKLKRKKDSLKPFTFKGAMLNGAELVGGGFSFLKLDHTPRALRVSFYEDFFKGHPEAMLSNISHRFRDPGDYEAQEIFYMVEDRHNGCKIVSPSGVLFYMQPKDKKDYVAKKISVLKRGKFKFCCFNSLESAPEKDINDIKDWIKNTIGI